MVRGLMGDMVGLDLAGAVLGGIRTQGMDDPIIALEFQRRIPPTIYVARASRPSVCWRDRRVCEPGRWCLKMRKGRAAW